MKDIAYGYWWKCEHCGEENAWGLTEEETDEEPEPPDETQN